MKIKQLFTLALAAGISATSVAETEFNLKIENTAILSYSVSGNDQSSGTGIIVDATNEFRVDRKVIFSVTSPNTVTTGEIKTTIAAAYTLTNDSNAPIRFLLEAVNVAKDLSVDIGGVPTKDTTSNDPAYSYYVDINDDGLVNNGDTALTGNYVELTSNTTAKILVAATPTIGINKDIFAHNLTVTAQESAASIILLNATNGTNLVAGASIATSSESWDKDKTQTIVSSDDVTRLGAGAIEISSAELSMTKEVIVISADIDGVAVAAKAIPGAVLKYTLTVTNAGTVAATDVIITDTLPKDYFNLADAFTEEFTVADADGNRIPTAGSDTATQVKVTSTADSQELVFPPVKVNANDGTNDGIAVISFTVKLI